MSSPGYRGVFYKKKIIKIIKNNICSFTVKCFPSFLFKRLLLLFNSINHGEGGLGGSKLKENKYPQLKRSGPKISHLSIYLGSMCRYSCRSWRGVVPRSPTIYLSRINVSVQLPQLKRSGSKISNWEVMEKVKEMARPFNFPVFKVNYNNQLFTPGLYKVTSNLIFFPTPIF